MKTNKAIELIQKAERFNDKIDTICSQLVNDIFKKYKKSLTDAQYEDSFLSDIGCFIQAGDGMVFTDNEGSNVPVTIITGIIENKGYFDYTDFKESRI